MKNKEASRVTCRKCGKRSRVSRSYACLTCDFFLHEQCMQEEPPSEISHFFHPCPLRYGHVGFLTCNACKQYFGRVAVYHCSPCDFDLDLDCALYPPLLPQGQEEEGMILRHFCHQHLLTLLDDVEDGHSEDCFCEVCREVCSCLNLVYTCQECKFYIHKSCLDVLPREMKDDFHQGPLVLMTMLSYKCKACERKGKGLCFRCNDCSSERFTLCLECAMLSTNRIASDNKVVHFFHSHALIPFENIEACCNACGINSSDLIFGCSKCNFFLHKSCAKLPREVNSSFHLDHTLHLKNMASQQGSKELVCRLCLKECSQNFAYCCDCEECDFLLDTECAFLMPTIDYGRHKHFLTLVKNFHDDQFKCSNFKCRRPPKNFPVFRCMECNFNLHLLCGPLPCTIKHESHVHPLKIEDYFMEDDRFDYCCHVCEEARDPDLCVYYCLDCPFFADVKCVMSEVIRSLRRVNGDVALRTTGRRIPCKLIDGLEMRGMKGTEAFTDPMELNCELLPQIVYREISRSFSEDDKLEYDNPPIKPYVFSWTLTTNENEDEDTFAYSDEAFTRLINKISSSEFSSEVPDFEREYYKCIPVFRDYLLPENLVSTFEKLLAKYGNISDNSLLRRPKVKSIFFYQLCSVLEDMCTTKVVDVTEKKLCQWWTRLDPAKRLRFDVQFIFDHMKFVARVHFGLRAHNFVEGTRVELEGKIGWYQEEIKELTRKLKQTEKQLKKHKIFVKSATTTFLTKSMQDALKMQWRYAATGLL